MFKSKFPDMQESIFPVISRLANAAGATNLGQGFPNFEAHEYVFERLNYYTLNKFNQYAPGAGYEKLRNEIAKAQANLYGHSIDPNKNITVTSGATEGIFTAIATVINPGDEAIIFDPSYDSYDPNIRLNGGIPIHIHLDLHNPGYDWNIVATKITKKTKLIIINTPHNPSGLTLKQEDLDALWDLIKDKDIFVLSDEVYQHIIFDGQKHISPFNDERFKDRTFSVSSFGKSFHNTGWRLGYCLASEKLTHEFQKIHQYVVYCSMGSTQMALADMMEKYPNWFTELGAFYQAKRDLFLTELKKTQFIPLKCEGSYFQLVDYSAYAQEGDFQFCENLIHAKKLAAIPVSVLYEKAPKQQIIRFCFAKTDDVLRQAFQEF